MNLNNDLTLVIDFENASELPSTFRSTRFNPQSQEENLVTWLGWDRLNASAARQFSELDLIASLGHMSGEVLIVDLRQESHGFVDGTPVSWYGLRNQANVGKTEQQIAELEERLVSEMVPRGTIRLNSIVQKTNGRILETSLQEVGVERSETERELVERLGLKYIRFPVTDHQHPDALTVDRFLDFAKSLPEDSWVHFHCRSGKGRSSTFMVLHDIFHNAGDVSLEDIITRNALAGSKNVSKISDLRTKSWKTGMARKRHQFVATFYSYMTDPGGYGRLRWSEWLTKLGEDS